MSKPVKSASTQARRPGIARWRPLARASVMAVLGMTGWHLAQAESLVDLYVAAKNYDAAYLSTKAQADSVQYKVEQARAAFRPSVGLSALLAREHFDASAPPQSIAAPPQFGLNGITLPGGNYTKTTKNLGLAVKQSLYNQVNAAATSEAEQSLIAAQADVAVAENDLMARLTQAYFDVLAAQDVLATTQANMKALTEQLASAKRNFEVGNATITDTREAQARNDLAFAQEIAATNDLQVKRIALDQLVGRSEVKPSPLRTPVMLDALAPGVMDDWVAQTSRSPKTHQAEVALEVAKLEVEKAKAGHLPTLDAKGTLGRNVVDSSSSSAKASGGTVANISLEFNMPLYAGGAIQNQVKEKLRLQDKAERDLDNAKRSVALATRQAFSGVQSGLAQVKAYEAAEVSAKLALEATQLGYRVGVRINKDVLDAQTQLTSTRKDLYKARYDVIVGTVKLKQASGALTADDLIELNKLVEQ